ncbi:uncharacterized protein LOC121980053 [Zingiber officinale]|uniref:uncharacterized protein LOC121980053 n=1 Tax=Zingiber officinale TaxID=94328 RepID=UPI001C4A975B|nr:uncharacterized protein LOC121980053 [Zingiber officinale]XP_042387966.1 uncharacterized protein LOC121980053 [Zingiber officinale]
MALAAAAALKEATKSLAEGWRIIPRPILETILNNYAHHHRVHQPVIFHGPRGVGKTSLLLHRLLPEWNKGAHVTAYVDFAGDPFAARPWASFSTALEPPSLGAIRGRLESELEALVDQGVRRGSIGCRDVFDALNKWHGLHTALKRIIGPNLLSKRDETASVAALWSKAMFTFSSRIGSEEINANLATEEKAISAGGTRKYSMGEVAHMRETAVSIKLAKEVIKMHQEWRREAVRDLNRKGGFSRSLANSSTDWPSLLLDILSSAAEIDFFQPKLVINNVDVLRKAILTDDSTVSATMYHDSFIWRLIALGVNERCLPVVLVTSDSYYSYRAFIDFGFPNIFISRETFGWTPQEAKLHMVSDFFKESEWKVIDEVLGSNPRQLYELYVLKQSGYYPEAYQGDKSNFEDIVDAYLSYLQVTVVNPAMESALLIVQKFAFDAYNGKVSEDRLHFGAPWRHPPRTNDPVSSIMWAKIQLVDFVQSFLITEFGVNYLADQSLEILDDPSLLAMLEVGLLYTQRDPSFVRPITRGIQRCLVRWLVQQKLQMDFRERLAYLWQRIIRGRSYRHLMKESGYKR